MRSLYLSQEVPRYLDDTAQRLFREGRETFHRHGHAGHRIFSWKGETLLFPWRGDRIMNTLLVTLASHGWAVGQDGLCLTLKGISAFQLWELVQELAAAPHPDPLALARTVRVRTRDKYDRYLGKDLLDLAYAARALDVPGTWELLGELAGNCRLPSRRKGRRDGAGCVRLTAGRTSDRSSCRAGAGGDRSDLPPHSPVPVASCEVTT